MKNKIVLFLLVVSLFFALTSVTALAVPDGSGNVGDDSGVVTTEITTEGVPGTTGVSGTTILPGTTATPGTTAAPGTTATPGTTAPTTTSAADDSEGGSVLGIVLAVLIALAIVVLAILFIPRMRGKGSR